LNAKIVFLSNTSSVARVAELVLVASSDSPYFAIPFGRALAPVSP